MMEAYPAGRSESAPEFVDGPYYGAKVEFDITEHLDPAVEIRIESWASSDGGLTWQFIGGCARMGRPAVDEDGKPITTADFTSIISLGEGKSPPFVNPMVKTVLVASDAVATRITLTPIQVEVK